MDSMITIHNQSPKTISLIPFYRYNHESFDSLFDVTKKLARNISAGQVEKVDLNNYRVGHEVKNRQIYMLFRVGEFPGNVKREETEELFLCTDLAEWNEWNLSLDEREQVIVGRRYAADQAASGAEAAAPQDESLLERLNKQVEELQKKVEDLEKKVKELEGRLPR